MDYNTFHNQIYVQGGSQDCSLVGLIQTPNGNLALVFNRHPYHQLGCDSVWGRFPHLVDRRTPFVALAVPRHFFVDWFTVRGCRELGKEKSETKSSAK
jgi:hypothetical protein